MDLSLSPDLDDDMDDPDDPSATTPPPAPDPLKDLRRAARDGAKAKDEVAALRKEMALLKAGVDVDTPLGRMFAKGYDGEVTPDAIKAEWASVNGLSDPSLTPDPVITPDELASTAARSALANGSPPDVPPVSDPRTEASKNAQAVLNSGGTSEASFNAAFETLVGAAMTGDKRAVVETSWKPTGV